MEQRLLGTMENGPTAMPPIHAVLDNVRSAFNTGSIFRTADAAGIAHLHLCGVTGFPPNHKLFKTALGALDYVPWTRYKNSLDAVRVLRLKGIPTIAIETAPHSISLFEFDWPPACAVIFGNEVTGISQEVLSRADSIVSIPMLGHKNTINVATAFGIVAYELLRIRASKR
jgi:23S rRNA (guanosine2251-2'-O)-methyltransferase